MYYNPRERIPMTKRKLKKLFLAQSYLDSWDEYQRSLRKSSYITWDYVILTASNEEQALAYEQQILDRLTLGLLPEKTVYKVLPDPDGKRVGSGGFQIPLPLHQFLPPILQPCFP